MFRGAGQTPPGEDAAIGEPAPAALDTVQITRRLQGGGLSTPSARSGRVVPHVVGCNRPAG